MVNYYYSIEPEDHIMERIVHKNLFREGWMLGNWVAADASCGHTFCIQIDKVLTSPTLSRGSLVPAPTPREKYFHIYMRSPLHSLCHNLIYYRLLSHESVEQLITHALNAAHMEIFHIRILFDQIEKRLKKKTPKKKEFRNIEIVEMVRRAQPNKFNTFSYSIWKKCIDQWRRIFISSGKLFYIR